MKISLNEIKKYVAIPAGIATAELVERIGSRLVEVEGTEDWGAKYRDIVIVKIVACEEIPDTHLHLCQVDDGSGELTQVVCGAPNVRAGMLAVWLRPGTVVPATYGEENFRLGVRKLRGFESHGMLAAPDELALGSDHAGIAEIDPKFASPGDDFAAKFELNDVILDIENKSLTHRPDCFGLIGFAREVAGILGVRFTEPEIFAGKNTLSELAKLLGRNPAGAKLPPLHVKIADPGLCPRYTAAILTYAETPHSKYLTPADVFLAKAGMRALSPIVDLTNILMLQTGQPLHAFDYDKLARICGGKVEIRVREARAGESLQLLDGKTIACEENDILICAGDTPVALAGAMGGASTAIDASTKRIVLESATFSLFHLRKTQMAHGIFSEAITRFTKGQPAWLTEPVLVTAVTASGARLEAIAEDYPAPARPAKIQISTGEINGLLGTAYSHAEIENTLENVGFRLEHCDPGVDTPAATFNVTAPPWRTDIHIKEDLIEEVGRLLGYDEIAPAFPRRDFKSAAPDPLFFLKTRLRRILAGDAKAHEVLTYSFVSESLQTRAGENPDESYRIVNSISPELQCFRQSLTPSLLAKIRPNLKAGFRDFTLFEINQVTRKGDLEPETTPAGEELKIPRMQTRLALASLRDFYYLKQILLLLAQKLQIELKFAEITGNPQKSADFAENSEKSARNSQDFTQIPPFLSPQRTAKILTGDTVLGFLGEISLSVRRNFKLENTTVSACEIDLEKLLGAPQTPKTFRENAKFPSVFRDLTLAVPTAMAFGTVADCLARVFADARIAVRVTPTSIYMPASDTKTKHLSFHLEFLGLDHTFTNAEISAIMEKVNKTFGRLGAEIV